jgi:phosphoribosyl-ATP pyrophosphohydrolase/phosphoribosyl-AMP cyclohydrolase
MSFDIGFDPGHLRYDERGLLPVVVQDVSSGAVLMVAWADRAAVERTRETGFACFFSRSRQQPWMKGETSGHRLAVVEALADCDRDTLLLRVRPEGPACHRGTRTCFEPNPARLELGWLARVVSERAGADPESSYTARLLASGRTRTCFEPNPASSYTARLLASGPERIARKLGEEALETVLAAVAPEAAEAESLPENGAAGAAGDGKDGLAWEAADLLYHLLVLLEARGVGVERVAAELERRHHPQEEARA